jgi:hypothetical protein
MMNYIREIRTPLELKAFFDCSDDSLKEFCRRIVALLNVEKLWATSTRWSQEEVDEKMSTTNSACLKKDELSNPVFGKACDELFELQHLCHEFDGHATVMTPVQLLMSGTPSKELLKVVYLARYEHPQTPKDGDAYYFDAGGRFIPASLNLGDETIANRFRQYDATGRYDDIEDPETIPPFKFMRKPSLDELDAMDRGELDPGDLQ